MNSRSFTVCVLAHLICLLNQLFESSCQPLHFHHKRMLPFGKELNGSRGLETKLNSVSPAEVTSRVSVVPEHNAHAVQQSVSNPNSLENVSGGIDGPQNSETNTVYRWDDGEYSWELSRRDQDAIDALPQFDGADEHHTSILLEGSHSSVTSNGRHLSLNGKEEAGSGSPASDTESITSSSRSNQFKSQETSTWSSSDPNREDQELTTKPTADSPLRQSVRSHDTSKNHEDKNNSGRGFKRQKVELNKQNNLYRTRAKGSWKEPDEAESSLKAEVSSNSNTEKDTTD
ncbi:hypothetical protein CROQUDRAFT_437547 [Cronartium quercuum f. sp. fusiforme G11]|uniref:Uncharacterized protein n=1 Tax=Cronartium quercuum f. sp. fusiforme G11 TaxID=708437 RepID=A0A9P6N5G4_9BASI|nr:hypothetical protein CROQUDRAFT_437547 [Cronartium quercuum f. sp. fusiforme G11]